MTTLLFVHGTGVRGAAYDASFAAIRAQAAHHLGAAVQVQPCQWGDHVGATIEENALSVPGYEVGRSQAGAGPSAREQEVRWRLLYEDPLYELRSYAALTAGADPQGIARSPHAASPAERALSQLATLLPSSGALARNGHLSVQLLPDVLALLRQDGTFADALEAEALTAPERSRPVIARAFVAAWAQAAEARGLPALDGELRDGLYEDAVAVLGGATKGLLDEFIGALGGLASRIATPILRRKRTGVTDASFAATHDILRYQTPHGGEAIRGLIAERIRACAQAPGAGPVWLLAHSLGGIASVELLASTSGLPVAGLITCGSQAPYLYEADALSLLRRGQALPEHFPRWLNVYDLNDLLSYVGSGLFGARVVDQEVRSRQPFPQSHSAYWANAALWRHIRDFMQ
ncbi:hypothetical protein [Aquincola tertiaricarbonis]|uniref:hypothetical protein n=1 Tax=Aquincola tertiaricarbonis TaxID=391953 RepID=UPI000615309F|nr:hypothetical protein [Aquincola tertiaricarbonis]